MSTQFVRVPGNPPRFSEVPDSAKAPLGPYRQAPAEYGGEWWYVNPFAGAEPWVTQGKKVEQSYPEGFLDTFGPRPQAKDFPNGNGYREAVVRWEQDLKYFKGAQWPEDTPDASVANAAAVAEDWGLGGPRPYEGRYGFMVRFPDSQLLDFECSAYEFLNFTHLVVARYQIELVNRGLTPDKRHPFTPPHIFGD
jgi:hypothetical protein